MKMKSTLTFRLILLVSTVFLAPHAQIAVRSSGESNGLPQRAEQSPRNEPACGVTAEIVDFSGEGTDEIFPNPASWTFFGPTRRITVGENQKLVGVGAAVFGMTAGISRLAVSLCYQRLGEAAPVPFNGNSHLTAEVDLRQRTFSVSGTAAPPPGSYAVGYCVVNQGKQIIGRNNYVNGWVMLIN